MSSQKEKIAAMENSVRHVDKRLLQIEQNLTKGDLEGSVIDSMNFLVQLLKSQNQHIQQTLKQMNNQGREVAMMRQFHIDEKIEEKYIEARTKMMTPPAPPPIQPQENKDENDDPQEKDIKDKKSLPADNEDTG